MYHEVSAAEPYECFVLFNSGVGHSEEGINWRITLDMLSKEVGKRALFTSFNRKDFERDINELNRRGLKIEYQELNNPLGSTMREPISKEDVYVNNSALVLQLG